MAGIATVGTFFVSTPSGDTSCTGSVVDSPGHNLVLTAGHCAYGWAATGVHRIFVPKFTAGQDAAHQPYGFFPVSAMFLDPRFKPTPVTDAATNLDFAFAQVSPNDAGQQVQDLTGALTLTRTPSYANTGVTVVGYPQTRYNPTQQALSCTVPTSRLPGYQQMQMLCQGFYNGVSGGPWILNYNADTGTGQVIGVIGGRGGGGDDANDDWVSYSPMFTQDITALYNDAVAGRKPVRGPYQVQQDPAVVGGAGRWKGARLLASGDYMGTGHSDLLAVWADGTVSVFPSDGYGNLLAERVLLKANARWRTAKAIASGDFDGGSRFDLMVLWKNGAVSSFPDVSGSALGKEKAYARPGTAPWTTTDQIVAGRFSGSKWVTDLIARGANGRVTLYTGVGGGHFGTAHTLRAPNATWKYATLLAGGQYSGTATWDLLVRWVDGEVDGYPGTTAKGIGPEQQLQRPHSAWIGAAAITTGQFTPNPLVDDLLVRWSTGETTMYPDTRKNRIGAAHPLVPVR